MTAPASSPQPPRLPAALERSELAALAHDDVHAELQLADLALQDQLASGVTLRGTTRERVDLSGSQLDRLTIVDATVRACNLANVRAHELALTRVVVDGSRLTGIALAEARLQDVTF